MTGPGHRLRPAQPELPRVDAGSRQPDHQGQQRQAPFEDEQPHVERPPRLRIGAQPPLEPAVQHVPGDGLADDQVTGDHDGREGGQAEVEEGARQPGRAHAGARTPGRGGATIRPRRAAGQRAGQVGRVRAGELHPPAVGRVREAQRTACSHCRLRPSRFGQRRVGAVGEVADARVPERGQVHPDLVGAAGLQVDVEQAGAPGTPRASRSA